MKKRMWEYWTLLFITRCAFFHSFVRPFVDLCLPFPPSICALTLSARLDSTLYFFSRHCPRFTCTLSLHSSLPFARLPSTNTRLLCTTLMYCIQTQRNAHLPSLSFLLRVCVPKLSSARSLFLLPLRFANRKLKQCANTKHTPN